MSTTVSSALLWLAGGLLTTILGLNAKRLTTWLGLLDVPDERKKHKAATPLLGGVALQAAFIPCAIVMALVAVRGPLLSSILVWLAAVAAMTLVGLADDRHSLSPRDRLLISFLVFGSAALVDPLFNVRVLSFEHPAFQLGLGTGAIAIFFTSLCCVGLVNAINMADGKNGLVIGLCLGWLAILAIRAPVQLLPFIGLLAGVLAVLLLFNLRGLLFLGDGGAYGLACAIGLLTIMMYNMAGTHGGRLISAEEIMLLFAVPVIDAFRLTGKRLKRGQSPMAADRDHFHHILQDGVGWPQGLILYWVIALAPALMVIVAA